MPPDSNCSAAAANSGFSWKRRSPALRWSCRLDVAGDLSGCFRLPTARCGEARNVGLAARPHFLSVRPIARRLPEYPPAPGCGKIQLSLADVPRTRSRLIPVEVHDFRFPGSANSRSAPGFWNSALAYCLCGSGKPGWRQAVLHSPRVWTEPAQSERKQVCAHYCRLTSRFPILTLGVWGLLPPLVLSPLKNLPEETQGLGLQKAPWCHRQASRGEMGSERPIFIFLLLGYTSVFGMCLPQTGY